MANAPYDVLSNFLLPTDDGQSSFLMANAPLVVASRRDDRRRELETQLANNPDDRRTQLLLKFLNGESAQDPLSAENIAEANRAQELERRKVQESGDVAKAMATGKGMGELDVENSPAGEYAASQASKRKIAELQAPIKAKFGQFGDGSDSAVSTAIDNLAKEYAANPSYPIPPDMKDAVVARAASSAELSPALTNQGRARQEGAAHALDAIPELRAKAQELQDSGWFNPLTGRVRKFMASNGLPLPGDADLSRKMSNFESQLGFLVKQMQFIHAGARGGASKDLSDAFNALINGRGSLDNFLGQLDAAEELMHGYHLDKPAAAGGNMAGGDPYSDPNWGR